MAEVNGSAAAARGLPVDDLAQAQRLLARVAALARLVLNAVASRREYHDGRLHVDAADVADVLHAIACFGREARQLDWPPSMDWAHLWGTTALLDAEGMRWLEVHNSNPPECDLAAAEAALQLVVELSEGIAARLTGSAAVPDPAPREQASAGGEHQAPVPTAPREAAA